MTLGLVPDLFFPSDAHRKSLLGQVAAGGFKALSPQDLLEFHAYRYAWRRVRLGDFVQSYQVDPTGQYFDGVLVGRAVEFYGGIKTRPVLPPPSEDDIAHVAACMRQIRANLDVLAERNASAFTETDLGVLQAGLGLELREQPAPLETAEI